jgi:hypothetical protein
MKLSELQHICNNLSSLVPEDAEVVFRLNNVPMALEGATMEGVTEVNMTRGCLDHPKVFNRLLLDFRSVDGIL